MPNTIEVTARVRSADKVIKIKKRDLNADEDDEGLAWFDFDAEDSVAQATGTLVWDASLAIVELLNAPDSWLLPALAGKRVLELGSGTGLAGLCCAAAGAHMLLTDLASIADGILARNVAVNVDTGATRPGGSDQAAGNEETAPAAAAAVTSSAAPGSTGLQGFSDTTDAAAGAGADTGGGSEPWPGAESSGRGSVRVMPLDFCRPLQPQGVAHGCDPLCAEVVLAIDIVWLKELVTPLAAAIAPILHHTSSQSQSSQPAAPTQPRGSGAMPAGSDSPSSSHDASALIPQHGNGQVAGTTEQSTEAGAGAHNKVAFLAFGERATESSTRFLQLDEVRSAFQQQRCLAEVRARHVVERPGADRMSVVVLQVTPVAL